MKRRIIAENKKEGVPRSFLIPLAALALGGVVLMYFLVPESAHVDRVQLSELSSTANPVIMENTRQRDQITDPRLLAWADEADEVMGRSVQLGGMQVTQVVDQSSFYVVPSDNPRQVDQFLVVLEPGAAAVTPLPGEVINLWGQVAARTDQRTLAGANLEGTLPTRIYLSVNQVQES
jgi:hypothetical protein